MVEPRPAATVALLRDGDRGPETLLLRRSARLGFFPLAWVFPGGRVDAADSAFLAAGAALGAVPGLPAELAAAGVAAIRECYEEAGLWLGDGAPPPGLREALNQRSGSLLDAPGLRADLSRLALWARWVTPEVEPKRFDTWFFLAAVEGGDDATADDGETTGHVWRRPIDILDNQAEFPLAPPTFRTLEELAAFPSAAAALAAAPARRISPVMPRLEQHPESGAWQIVLPGDPTYPAEVPVLGATRICYGEGGWRSQA